jgi:hypothetical protein
MNRPKKVIIPIKPEESNDLKTYKKVKQQLSVYDKIKQFFNQLNLF